MIHHRPRLVGASLLGTRRAAAVLTHRNPDLIRRHCQPVACDVTSRATLYDLDEVAAAFADTPRRCLHPAAS